MSLDELACKYDAAYAYVRRITSKCRDNSRAKPISDEEKKEIIRLRNNGMTITAIAESVGRSGTAVGEVLRQNGFETDLRIPKQVIAQAETLIREGDKSYREIAALLGMSTSNVSRVAKSIGAESNYKHNAKRVLCIESGEIFSSATEELYNSAKDETHSAEQAALNGVNKAQEKAQEITLRNIDEATQRSKKAIDTMVLESKRRIERLAMVTLPDRMFHFLKWTALMLVLFILVHIVWQMFS